MAAAVDLRDDFMATALRRLAQPNRGIVVDAKHSRPTPKGTSLTNGRVLHRPHRHQANDPLP